MVLQLLHVERHREDNVHTSANFRCDVFRNELKTRPSLVSFSVARGQNAPLIIQLYKHEYKNEANKC
jgi:hypothetical protein